MYTYSYITCINRMLLHVHVHMLVHVLVHVGGTVYELVQLRVQMDMNALVHTH